MAHSNVVVHGVQQAEEVGDKHSSISERIKNFCLRNSLPIGTIFSVIFGIFLPQPAVYVSQRIPVIKICIIVVFLAIGLRLRAAEAKSAVKCYKDILIGLLLVLFASPIFATNVLNQIPCFGSLIGSGQNLRTILNSTIEEMPVLGPEEFRLALQVYCLCPSPTATSVILVTAANGYRSLSILVSILCIFISVFTIPLMLRWLVPTLQHVHINYPQLLLNILLKVLLPLVIGRCLRCVPAVKQVVVKWNSTIRYIGIISLFPIFLVKVSETSASGNLGKISMLNILSTVALGAGLTTFNAVSTYGVLSILPWFSKKTTVTLSILSCIRVIGLAATIVDALPGNVGDKGLVVLPMVFVYLATLLILNGLVTLVKVKEDDDTGGGHLLLTTKQDKEEKSKNITKSSVNSKISQTALITIYTQDMSIKTQKL